MFQIVAPWLLRGPQKRILGKSIQNQIVERLDSYFTLKSSQRRMRDRPFAQCARAAVRDHQQSGAGFSIYELDRALAMLWS